MAAEVRSAWRWSSSASGVSDTSDRIRESSARSAKWASCSSATASSSRSDAEAPAHQAQATVDRSRATGQSRNRRERLRRGPHWAGAGTATSSAWPTAGGAPTATWHAVDDDARGALRDALGATEHPDGPPPGPAMWFVRPGARPAGVVPRRRWCSRTATRRVRRPSHPARRSPARGATALRPTDGHRHRRWSSCRARGAGARRGWGWSAQLYGCRSAASWGHGDLADLADLARWARDGGGVAAGPQPAGRHPPGAAAAAVAVLRVDAAVLVAALPAGSRTSPGAELAEDAVARGRRRRTGAGRRADASTGTGCGG